MSLIQAIIDTVQGNFVSDEARKQRMFLCNGCNNNRGGTCIKCGCFIKWKTMCPSEECPIGKWSKQETE